MYKITGKRRGNRTVLWNDEKYIDDRLVGIVGSQEFGDSENVE